MLEVTVLASGSAGNAMLVRCGATAVLVDAGISARRLQCRLESCGVTLDELAGILITHEHSDHSAALRVLCAQREIALYCNKLTAEALIYAGLDGYRNWRYFTSGAPFGIGELTIEAFSVPHDAADPVGFRIANAKASAGVLTDLGFATNHALDRLRGANLVLIEANHDEELLQNDRRRPWSLKQRILSRHGHLSNAAAAAAVRDLSRDPALERVVLGHLSRDCNRPELAIAAARGALDDNSRHDIDVFCAEQGATSPTWRVHGAATPA